MSLEKMRKSIQNLLGIQSNTQHQQPAQESRKYQTEQKLPKSEQFFKNKFVSIQKKENKLNPYKFALDRLKEFNQTIYKANDLIKCPIISYKLNEQEKKIHPNLETKPRWSNDESSFDLINIKPKDERKSFFFHAQYINEDNKQPTQSKQTARKSQISSRTSEFNLENNFDKDKYPDLIFTKSKQQKEQEQEQDPQSGSESIIVKPKSETKFRKLKPQEFETKQVILIQDQKQISEKKEPQNIDNRVSIQKQDIQEKQSEQQSSIQTQQLILTDPTNQQEKQNVVENKQESKIESQVETKIESQITKIDPQIQNQVQQYNLDENPFTQNIQNQLFNPPWINNNTIQDNQVSFNLFQQPLIQQQPQGQQQQPQKFQNSMDQQSYNLFPFQNLQTTNVFSNQNQFPQQPNLFQNNQQSNQTFNLFNQTNTFQQQIQQQPLFQQQQSQQSLFQQPTSESLFQQQSLPQPLFQSPQPLFQQQSSAQALFQQQPSPPTLFQQQPSTQSLFQQQSQTQQLFQQQPQQQSLFDQQPAMNFFQTSGVQQSNQLFQQPNQQAMNLFANNDQRQNQIDLFSAQPQQNTPNLFQLNQAQVQDLFSLNTQQQQNNNTQQRACSQSDRYKKNLTKQTTSRI
ncbi:unnamed protein product [Paramecium sonneborni]|uniref:Uncharacterized protein n=1 Tax=Paramecium sonneborni TaxID=65129 RepID=A0A8S1PZM1_9CILI|nr:unnamed protein product [Paramecium sonneborni]